MYSMLQSQRRYSTSSFSINVKNVEGHKLYHVTLIIRDHGDTSNMTITAQEAELKSGVNDHGERVLKIFLRDGRIEVAGVSYTFSDVQEREIPLTDASRARNGGPQGALTLARLPEAIAAAKVQVDEQEQMMAALSAYDMTCGDLDDLTGDIWRMHENQLSDLRSRFFRLQSVPQRRWAGGFACLCFVLVGVPMAISLRNRDFLTSFFLCFLPILLVYYPLMIIGADQVKNGKLPVIFVWAGNGMLILWGLAMLRRVIRY
jgi:lipopolysaccharide export system permease protein